jgi:predicted SAM-dependent methyltransferase
MRMNLSTRGSPRANGGKSMGARLHVGCGQQALPGWINIDNQQLPGVDQVLDVRNGLPFENAEAIFAEHFIEHLTLDQAIAFLRESARALSRNGILRISTPNLDWVYLTHYRVDPAMPELESVRSCLQLNRAFHGWGHQFLFNELMLRATLKSVGFSEIKFCRYGESEIPFLRNIERHEKSDDSPDLPHVLIVEATGRAEPVALPLDLLQEHRTAIQAR